VGVADHGQLIVGPQHVARVAPRVLREQLEEQGKRERLRVIERPGGGDSLLHNGQARVGKPAEHPRP
jgi:hypothetical protein